MPKTTAYSHMASLHLGLQWLGVFLFYFFIDDDIHTTWPRFCESWVSTGAEYPKSSCNPIFSLCFELLFSNSTSSFLVSSSPEPKLVPPGAFLWLDSQRFKSPCPFQLVTFLSSSNTQFLSASLQESQLSAILLPSLINDGLLPGFLWALLTLDTFPETVNLWYYWYRTMNSQIFESLVSPSLFGYSRDPILSSLLFSQNTR